MSENILNPQQELFLERYTNPKSPTFSNALRSALEAGYSEDYANNITSLLPDWLSESMGDLKRLRKAERNLEEVQNLPLLDHNGDISGVVLTNRIKVDTFIAERLGKNKYSTMGDKALDKIADKVQMTPERLALMQEYEAKLREDLK